MRTLLVGSVFAILGLATASANAMQFPSISDQAPSAITLAAGGCGAAFHRGPNGVCRPNGYVRGATGYHAYRGRHCWWRNGVRVCN